MSLSVSNNQPFTTVTALPFTDKGRYFFKSEPKTVFQTDVVLSTNSEGKVEKGTPTYLRGTYRDLGVVIVIQKFLEDKTPVYVLAHANERPNRDMIGEIHKVTAFMNEQFTQRYVIPTSEKTNLFKREMSKTLQDRVYVIIGTETAKTINLEPGGPLSKMYILPIPSELKDGMEIVVDNQNHGIYYALKDDPKHQFNQTGYHIM